MESNQIIAKLEEITHGAGGSITSDINELVKKAKKNKGAYSPSTIAKKLSKLADGVGGGVAHTVNLLVDEIKNDSDQAKKSAK